MILPVAQPAMIPTTIHQSMVSILLFRFLERNHEAMTMRWH
jgi:hypothetical protein